MIIPFRLPAVDFPRGQVFLHAAVQIGRGQFETARIFSVVPVNPVANGIARIMIRADSRAILDICSAGAPDEINGRDAGAKADPVTPVPTHPCALRRPVRRKVHKRRFILAARLQAVQFGQLVIEFRQRGYVGWRRK